jgi:hypothetical protein
MFYQEKSGNPGRMSNAATATVEQDGLLLSLSSAALIAHFVK